ncbi:MAG: NAD(P)-dependent oxidoreductase [Pseudomonadota bacterium]
MDQAQFTEARPTARRGTSRLSYGFVGLGNLGARLAGNLAQAGFQVCVTDLAPERAGEVVAAGAQWADTAAEAAHGRDAVITCLPSPKISEELLLGSGALLDAMEPGATWIEMSTVDIDAITRLAGVAAERGIDTLEAPVTGGVHRAANGTITVLVGGREEVLEAHRPAFEAMCGPLFHLGDVGAASTIKVITNMLAFDHLIAAAEAMLLAKKAGLDLRQCYEVIRASSGSSVEFESVMPVILSGTFDTNFTMELACKDLGIAMRLGRKLDVPLKLSELVDQLFIEGRETFGPSAWTANIVKLMEDTTGVALRADGFPGVMTEGGTLDDQDK